MAADAGSLTLSAGGAVAPAGGGPDRALRLVTVAAVSAAVVALGATAAGLNPVFVAAPLTAGLTFAAVQHWLLAWRTLISLILGVILLVPMKRYSLLGGTLPFQIEPYRILIAAVAVGWIGTLLIDPAARIRRTLVDVPLFMFATSLLVSDFVNYGRVTGLEVGGEVMKKLTFFVTFVILVYLIASTITKRKELDQLIKVLVSCGAFVAVAGLYESRSGYNVFNHLHSIFPPLKLDPSQIPATSADSRGARLRIFASSEHPIALSAALTMLVPLGLYLAQRAGENVRARRMWLAMAGVTGLGVLATVSRTGIVMMFVLLVCYAFIKPAATRRALPLLLPVLVFAHAAVPGAMGSLKSAFFPAGGITAEQDYGSGTYGSGRLADLGPSIEEWKRSPLLGDGFGTRITDITDPRMNALILDDQWLGSLLETGLFGVFAFGWLLLRGVRRFGRIGRRDKGPDGWLGAGLAASVMSYFVGMFTFDAFNFYQVTLLLYILMALGAVLLRLRREEGLVA
jgi:polysaccharide biosynthesis protein PslJ